MSARQHLKEIVRSHTAVRRLLGSALPSNPHFPDPHHFEVFTDVEQVTQAVAACEESFDFYVHNMRDAVRSLLECCEGLRRAMESSSAADPCPLVPTAPAPIQGVALSDTLHQAAVVFTFLRLRMLPDVHGAVQRLCTQLETQLKAPETDSAVYLEMKSLLNGLKGLLAAVPPSNATPQQTPASSPFTSTHLTPAPVVAAATKRCTVAVSAAYLHDTSGTTSPAVMRVVPLCAKALPSVSIVLLCGVAAEEEEVQASRMPQCRVLITPHATRLGGKPCAEMKRMTMEQFMLGLERRLQRLNRTPLSESSALPTPLQGSEPSQGNALTDEEEEMMEFEAVLDALIQSPSDEASTPGRKRTREFPLEPQENTTTMSEDIADTVKEGPGLIQTERCVDSVSHSNSPAHPAAGKENFQDDGMSHFLKGFHSFVGGDFAMLSSQVVEYSDSAGLQRRGRSRTRGESFSGTQRYDWEEEVFLTRQRNIDSFWDAISASSGAGPPPSSRWLFQVSISIGDAYRHEVVEGVLALGSRLDTGAGFNAECTHLVVGVGHLERSEKYLCACAAGVLMVPPEFVFQSREEGQWIASKETIREWDCSPMRGVRCAAGKIFSKWRVVLMAEDAGVIHGIRRVLLAGGCVDVSGLLYTPSRTFGGLIGGDSSELVNFTWMSWESGAGGSAATSSSHVLSGAALSVEAIEGGGGLLDRSTHILVESRVFSPAHRTNFLMPSWMPEALYESQLLSPRMFSLDILHFCLCTRSVEVAGGRVFDDTAAAIPEALPPLKCRLMLPTPPPRAETISHELASTYSSFGSQSSVLATASGPK